jgi:Ca2+-transporting ATPase
MGLTTMSLIHVVLALEWRDPIRTIFNRDTFGNGKLNMLILAALAATYLATSLGALNRLLDTVNLAGDQWRPCLIAAVAFLVAAELEKVIVQRVVKEPV